MFFLADHGDLILNWLICLAIVFTVMDICLIYLIKTFKPLLENKYFNFHKRHGFLKVTVLKIAFILMIIYFLLNPGVGTFKLMVPIMVHGFMITKMLIDVIRKQG